MYLNKSVLFIFGTGGHHAQANRLSKILLPELEGVDVVTLSDFNDKPTWSDRHYCCGELRKKNSHSQIFSNFGPITIIMKLIEIKKKNKIIALISTGPGISILGALYLKLFGVKIIHIETWSRFETKSLTGRIMYLLSDRFYVQNRSLQKHYPKSIYSGKL
tara:strand:+ start:11103 stop:11585 length:483 start_codon:yes stop_codon:yes gene_type:complete